MPNYGRRLRGKKVPEAKRLGKKVPRTFSPREREKDFPFLLRGEKVVPRARERMRG